MSQNSTISQIAFYINYIILTVLYISMIDLASIILKTINLLMNKKSIRHTRMSIMKQTIPLTALRTLLRKKKRRTMNLMLLKKKKISLIWVMSQKYSSVNAESVINIFNLTISYTSIYKLIATIISLWQKLSWFQWCWFS